MLLLCIHVQGCGEKGIYIHVYIYIDYNRYTCGGDVVSHMLCDKCNLFMFSTFTCIYILYALTCMLYHMYCIYILYALSHVYIHIGRHV